MARMTQSERNVRNYYKEQLKRDKELIKTCSDIKEGLKSSWYLRSLLTNRQLEKVESMTNKEVIKMLLERSKMINEKNINKSLDRLNKIYAADDFRSAKCNIEWIKNRTWGYCPRGNYSNCFSYAEYRSITGCGYDKLSTLTAQMFNNDLHLLKLVAKAIDKKRITNDNIREILGYGIRISCCGIPYFEGGVGVECHINILRRLGLTVQHHSGNKYDLITIN